MQRTGAMNSLRFEVPDWAIFIAVQMETLRRNLFEMNFHS
jgi:hypothetical protein